MDQQALFLQQYGSIGTSISYIQIPSRHDTVVTMFK